LEHIVATIGTKETGSSAAFDNTAVVFIPFNKSDASPKFI
jgi:hypothetical protein